MNKIRYVFQVLHILSRFIFKEVNHLLLKVYEKCLIISFETNIGKKLIRLYIIQCVLKKETSIVILERKIALYKKYFVMLFFSLHKQTILFFKQRFRVNNRVFNSLTGGIMRFKVKSNDADLCDRVN